MIRISASQSRGFWASVVHPKVKKTFRDGSLLVLAPHPSGEASNWTQEYRVSQPEKVTFAKPRKNGR